MRARILSAAVIGLTVLGVFAVMRGLGLNAALSVLFASAALASLLLAGSRLANFVRWLDPASTLEVSLRKPRLMGSYDVHDWEPAPPFLCDDSIGDSLPPPRCADWQEWEKRGEDALWTHWELVCQGLVDREVIVDGVAVVVDDREDLDSGTIAICGVGGAEGTVRELSARLTPTSRRETCVLRRHDEVADRRFLKVTRGETELFNLRVNAEDGLYRCHIEVLVQAGARRGTIRVPGSIRVAAPRSARYWQWFSGGSEWIPPEQTSA